MFRNNNTTKSLKRTLYKTSVVPFRLRRTVPVVEEACVREPPPPRARRGASKNTQSH